MKKYPRALYVIVALIAIFVSACGGAASPSSAGGDKPRADLVEFTGVIESINGNQWTVNGQVITVEPSVLRDGPFKVGDTVKVEVEVQADGSVVVTRVEPPVAGVDDNANSNSNDDNSNSSLINANSNTNDNANGGLTGIGTNSNDDNSNVNDNNSNDDNSNDDHGGNNDNDSSHSGGDDDSGSNDND